MLRGQILHALVSFRFPGQMRVATAVSKRWSSIELAYELCCDFIDRCFASLKRYFDQHRRPGIEHLRGELMEPLQERLIEVVLPLTAVDVLSSTISPPGLEKCSQSAGSDTYSEHFCFSACRFSGVPMYVKPAINCCPERVITPRTGQPTARQNPRLPRIP